MQISLVIYSCDLKSVNLLLCPLIPPPIKILFPSCYQPRTLLDLWGLVKNYTMAEALGIHTPSDVSMTLERKGKLHAVSALHSLLSMFSGLKEHFQMPPYFPLIFPLRLPTLKPEVLPFSPLNLDLVLPLKLSLISSFIHSSWTPCSLLSKRKPYQSSSSK